MNSLEKKLAPYVSGLGKFFGRVKWPLEHRETVKYIEALNCYIYIFHFCDYN